MFLRKSHIAIDYFLLVEHKNERKKTSLGNGEVFFLLCFSAADRGTKNSQCISGRCREIIGWHCGLWNDGRIRDGIRPLDRQDDKRAPVWPRPPPDSQRAFPFIGFRRHVIIPPILKQPPPPPNTCSLRVFLPALLSGRKAGKVAGRFEDTLKETSAFCTHQRRSENKLCYK